MLLPLGLGPAPAGAHAPPGQLPAGPPARYLQGVVLIRLSSDAVRRPAFELTPGVASAPRTGLADVDAALESAGLEEVRRHALEPRRAALAAELGLDREFVVRVGEASDIELLSTRLRRLAAVEDASPDWLAWPTVVPNDPLYARQWGHDNQAQLKAWSQQLFCHCGPGVGNIDFDADIDEAWEGCQVFGDSTVVIAVLDTGVDIAGTGHPDLRVTTGWDFGDNDSDPHDDSAPSIRGHGTAVAGVAAAIANNNLGPAGVAAGCTIMPLKIYDSNGLGTSSMIRSALIYAADNGARIANMSFEAGANSTMQSGVDYAIGAGVILVAATGNSNNSTISYPARYDSVIAIGAASPCSARKSTTSCDGEWWWGSNYGTGIDFLAPTIVPTTDLRGSGGYNTGGDYYDWFNGTSASSPFAAGVAALILSRNPSLSRAQLKQSMVNAALDVTAGGASPGYDTQSGWGLVNAGAALAPFADVTTAPLDVGGRTGVAWGDYDADGDPDLYLAHWTMNNKLLRNDGAAGFVDVTSGPLGDASKSSSPVWADYDSDGDLDLFVPNWEATNKLFRNDGNDTFVDATVAPLGGPAGFMNAVGAGWADFDGDGEVELLVGMHGTDNELYLNAGCGTFLSQVYGTVQNLGNTEGIAWGDADNDGDPDAYVVNSDSSTPNQLLRNDGNLNFVDVATGPLADTGIGKGAAWADYDSDGDLDLYLADYLQANHLFRNDGNLTFTDVTSGQLGDTGRSGSVAWADYDLDTDLDLFVSTDQGANRLFRNDGGDVFTDVAFGVMADANLDGGGVAWADYDSDGDPDLYMGRQTANKLFRNDYNCGNHWLEVTLAGTASNAAGIGARVRAVTGPLSQLREISASSSYGSMNEPVALFGLAGATVVDTVEVRWPSGHVQVMTGVSVDQTLPVVEDAPWVQALRWGDYSACSAGRSTGAAWGDYDGDGDDDIYFAAYDQPNTLVRNDGGTSFVDATGGPLGNGGLDYGVAWGDADSDGDLDLVMAGGNASKLFRNDGGGSFADATGGALSTATGDAVAWGDYDNDGDLDLYVANYGAANKLLRNDGGLSFADVTSGPLGTSGPSVAAAWSDIDLDGDLDLYVTNDGAANRLLRNDGGGAFADIASGPIADAGKTFGAAWGDADADGDPDLYFCSWASDGKLLRNDGGGSFADVTGGPLANGGVGYGVAWGDVDLDGDLDLYLANSGSPNRLLRNDGGMSFTDITSPALAGTWWANSWGTGWSDMDLDGDLDLFVANWDSANRLLRNDALASGNNWFQVRLTGTTSNTSGIGSRVRIVAGGSSQVREIDGGSGLHSQGTQVASFGVGSATQIDTVQVFWPSGTVQVITDSGSFMPIAVNTRLEVEEPPSALLDFADHDVGNMILTMTDQGILGFMDDSQAQGSGLVFPAGGANHLFIGSAWASQGSSYVANRDYSAEPEKEWAVSLVPDGHVRVETEGAADQVIHTSYSDREATNPFGFYIRQESWAFSSAPDDDYVIVRYFIHNRSDTSLSDLRVGLFLDIDIDTFDQNTGGTDAPRRLAYMTGGTGEYVGARMLVGDASPDQLANLTLIHNPTYVWPQNYILDADKIGFIQGVDSTYVVPIAPDPDDYSLLVSAGPFALAPGDSNEVAFAIVAGTSLAALQASADQAQLRYAPTTGVGQPDAAPVRVTRLFNPAPNPFNPATTLRFDLAQPADVKLAIYDAGGRMVRLLVEGRREAGRHAMRWDGRRDSGRHAASGVYFLSFKADGRHETRRLVLLK